MPTLEIKLHGHLLVGGAEASKLGVDLSTARRFANQIWVPYIPATAVRGAVRLQLESLIAGLNGGTVGPYPFDSERPPTSVTPDAAVRLFGYTGPKDKRGGSREGRLRFSDALPSEPARAARALQVRAGVELDDWTGTAEDKKLFFQEVVETDARPLVFRCSLTIGDASPDDLRLLRAAVETTDGVGAGRSSGGGEISIRWVDGEEEAVTSVTGDSTTASRARLTFKLREPAHFGDGGPLGNHQATKTFIPGSTVRGALAYALLRNRQTQPQDEAFRKIFLDERKPVSFGDALPVPPGAGEPRVRPATQRLPRVDQEPSHQDILVRELARREINADLASEGLALVPDWRGLSPDPPPARTSKGLVRRVRTRVSIDRFSGAAAQEKLFSIEQIEPWQDFEVDTNELQGPTFVSWVEGLRPLTAELLAKLENVPILIGAGRNHGMGLVEASIKFESEPSDTDAEEKVFRFSKAVEKEIRSIAHAFGLRRQPSDTSLVWLALVAQSDFLGPGRNAHPLEDLWADAHLVARFQNPSLVGGYDQLREAEGSEQPLKDLLPAVGAGSVFVYRAPRESAGALLRRSLPILRRGIGKGIERGCGRFALWEEA